LASSGPTIPECIAILASASNQIEGDIAHVEDKKTRLLKEALTGAMSGSTAVKQSISSTGPAVVKSMETEPEQTSTTGTPDGAAERSSKGEQEQEQKAQNVQEQQAEKAAKDSAARAQKAGKALEAAEKKKAANREALSKAEASGDDENKHKVIMEQKRLDAKVEAAKKEAEVTIKTNENIDRLRKSALIANQKLGTVEKAHKAHSAAKNAVVDECPAALERASTTRDAAKLAFNMTAECPSASRVAQIALLNYSSVTVHALCSALCWE